MIDDFPHGWFVTGTGTGIGKTFLSRGLSSHFRSLGAPVVALKPLETGVDPDPQDALALARACGRPELAHAPGLYRARRPLAPYAATLAGEAPPAPIDALSARIHALSSQGRPVIVEGAGGLLVPLDAQHTIADLARALALPLLIVASDRLGVLSDVLACCEAASQRQLDVAAVVLMQQVRSSDDTSHLSNRQILSERLGLPVVHFPLVHFPQSDDAQSDDDDVALADAVRNCGLLSALGV